MLEFKYITNTPVLIDGKKYLIKFENGMTGIGSRKMWINDKKTYPSDCLIISDNLEEGNHSLYIAKWRDNPWDIVYFLVKNSLDFKFKAWQESKKVILLIIFKKWKV